MASGPPPPQRSDSLPTTCFLQGVPLIPPVPGSLSFTGRSSETSLTDLSETSITREMTDTPLSPDSTVFEFEAKDYWKDSFKVMEGFFQNGELCDVEIRAGKRKFRCHRVILACFSEYFRAMFMSEMAESKQAIITIKDIDELAMEKLINFAYTAKIVLTTETVQPILYAAFILQVDIVAQACCEFMKKYLHPSNCIGVHKFGEQHNSTDLMKMAELFIRDHFLEVVEAEEFKTMSVKLLERLLDSSHLNVSSEMRVFEALMKWIKDDVESRQQHLSRLMSKVKLPLLSTSYLMDKVASNPLVRNDLACRDLLDEAKYYQMSLVNLVSDIKITERSRPRKSYAGVLFCVGGRGSAGDPFKSIECYNPLKNKWFNVAEMNNKRRHVGVCANGGKLYAIGGHDGTQHLSTGEVFDPVTNKWSPISPMGTLRRGLALGSLGGPIYAVGGLDDQTCFNTVERYDPESDIWTFVAPMNIPRGGVGVTAMKGQLYAIGGNDGVSSLDNCERYDPLLNKWTQVKSMNKRRAGAGVAAMDGFIYVVGGFDDNSPLSSCEKYDPVNDTWVLVSNMSTPRGGVGVAALGGQIYAVGGHDGSSYLNSVESYDPLTDRWEIHDGIKVSRAGAGVVLLEYDASVLIDINDQILFSPTVGAVDRTLYPANSLLLPYPLDTYVTSELKVARAISSLKLSVGHRGWQVVSNIKECRAGAGMAFSDFSVDFFKPATLSIYQPV